MKEVHEARFAFENKKREAWLAIEKGPDLLTKAWWCDVIAPDVMVGLCTTAIAAAYGAPFIV